MLVAKSDGTVRDHKRTSQRKVSFDTPLLSVERTAENVCGLDALSAIRATHSRPDPVLGAEFARRALGQATSLCFQLAIVHDDPVPTSIFDYRQADP